MTPPLSLIDLTTGYRHDGNNIVITSRINASLPAGCLTSLLGPNGAGKSTLIKTLSGFLPALDGKVEIGGKSIIDYTPAELAKKLSVVLTERVDSTHLTVKDLVGLGRSPYTGFFGRLSMQDQETVDRSIAMVGIEHLASRTVSTLSDGERQKAMIARALAQETPVIFLDEPTAFLDYPGKVDVMILLSRLCHENGKSVLMSTHDIELAMLVSDRLWPLDRRQGLTAGAPEDLIFHGAVQRYFAGKHLHFDIQSCSFKVDFPVRGKLTVSGQGSRLIMIERALRRCGISVKSTTESPDIYITDEAYHFRGKEYASIESLVDAVNAAL